MTALSVILRELRRLKRLADRAVERTADDPFFTPLGADENSMAIIIKHLAGNMRSRWRDFLSSDGEKERDRDSEFVLTAEDSRQKLLAQWEDGWRVLFEAVTPLTPADLERAVTIRGESHTVFEALNRQLTHYAYHIGQLVLLARHFAGKEWKSLSIPRGESENFNKSPKNYL